MRKIMFLAVAAFVLFTTACNIASGDDDEPNTVEIICDGTTQDCNEKLEQAKANRQQASQQVSTKPIKGGGNIWGQGIDHKSILGGTGDKPEIVTTRNQGNWKVSEGPRLADNPIVADWIKRLKNPAPSKWKTFPNIRNADLTDAEFPTRNCRNQTNAMGVSEPYCEVPQGMEYGVHDSPFCEVNPCDFVVPAWEYRYYTGDYSFGGYSCEGDKTRGCMLVVINVMDETVIFREQYFDNGFTLHGRYWDGDRLEIGLWGVVSHGSANMLGMETHARAGEVLNADGGGNAGANCGTPRSCRNVDVRVIVVAGTDALAVLETNVSR